MVNGVVVLNHGTYAKMAARGAPDYEAAIESFNPHWGKLAEALPGAPNASGAAGAHEHEARKEAAERMIVNHEAVVRDIANPTQMNVVGAPLTQTDLKRIDPRYVQQVDACLREVVRRLLGADQITPEQKDQQTAPVWVATALYLSARLQSVAKEKSGRTPDFSEKSGLAIRAVLSEVASLM